MTINTFLALLIYITFIAIPTTALWGRARSIRADGKIYRGLPFVLAVLFYLIAINLQTFIERSGASLRDLISDLFSSYLPHMLGVGFDWIVNGVLRILEQLLIHKLNIFTSEDIYYTFVLNVGLLWVYTLLSVALTLPIHAIYRTRGPRQDNAISSGAKTTFLSTQASKNYWGVVFWGYAFVLFCLPFLFYYSETMPSVIFPTGVNDSLTPLIWIAPYIVFAEILLFIKAPAQSASKGTNKKSAAKTSISLKTLYDTYVKDYKTPINLIISKSSYPGGGFFASEKAKQKYSLGLDFLITRLVAAYVKTGEGNKIGIPFDQLGDTLVNFFKKPTLVRFAGNITDAHYRIIAELIQQCQEEGGVTLLIVPSAAVDNVRSNIEQTLTMYGANIIERIHILGGVDPAVKTTRYSTIIAPGGDLHSTILRDPDPFERELERLKLIVCLGFHDLDIPILELSLTRLKKHLQKYADISVIVQGEERIGQSAALENMFDFTEKQYEIKLRTVDHAKQYRIIWRNSKNLVNRIVQNVFSKDADREPDTLPLLMIPSYLWRKNKKMDTEVSIDHFDPHGRRRNRTWEIDLGSFVMASDGDELNNLKTEFFGQKSQRHLTSTDGLPVIFQEDTRNLIDVIDRNMNYSVHDELFVNILCSSYPLREFLVEKAEEYNISYLKEKYLPISPVPKGGLKELAIILAEEMTKPGGISQNDVEKLFQELLPDWGIAEVLDISPTESGIDRLFQNQFGHLIGDEIQIGTIKNSYHEMSYSINAGVLPDLSQLFFRAILLHGNMEGHVHRRDYGLSYAKNNLFQHNGKCHQIIAVDENKITIERNEGDPGRLVYEYQRHYRLSFENMLKPDIRDQEDRGDLKIGRGVLYLYYMRKSLGRYQYAELHPPFGNGTPHASFHEHTKSIDAQYDMRGVYWIQYDLGQLSNLSFAENEGVLAFTLSATLQDVLISLFPKDGHRIAAVSPQAIGTVRTALNSSDYLKKYIVRRYPQLDPGLGLNDSIDPYINVAKLIWKRQSIRAPDNIELVELAARQIREVRESLEGKQADPGDNDIPTDNCDSRPLDFFIIEDSDYNLGVVNAVDEEWDKIVFVWRNYVEWLAENTENENIYHRFGSSVALCDVFDFKSAKAFFDEIEGPIV